MLRIWKTSNTRTCRMSIGFLYIKNTGLFQLDQGPMDTGMAVCFNNRKKENKELIKMAQRLLRYSLAVVIILSIFVLDTHAQGESGKASHSGLGFGLRGGFGLDPDQFVVGAQFSLGQKFHFFRVVPSVDLGLGDNMTSIDFNVDLLLRLIAEDISFGIYGGIGPTLAYLDSKKADSKWRLGLSTVAGTQLPLSRKVATNIEGRFGIGKIPDFRLLLAIIF